MEIDKRLFYLVNHLPHNQLWNSLAVALHYLTSYGSIFVAIFIVNIFSANKDRKLLGKVGLVSIIVTGIFERLIIKNIVHRGRPFQVLADVITIGPDPSGYSFPSGQTAAAFAAATVYWLMFPKTSETYFLLLLALLTGLDRIYMGHHFPLDVLFGALMGAFCSSVIFSYRKKFSLGML